MLFASLIFVHVLSGMVWALGAWVLGFFVVPALVAAGPGGAAATEGLLKGKLLGLMRLGSVLAVLSGAGLWVLDFGSKGGWAWLRRPDGAVLSLAALGALHALVKSRWAQQPAAAELAALAARLGQASGKPDPALLEGFQAAQRKLAKLTRSAGAELLGVAALMALHQVLALLG